MFWQGLIFWCDNYGLWLGKPSPGQISEFKEAKILKYSNIPLKQKPVPANKVKTVNSTRLLFIYAEDFQAGRSK